MTVTAWYDRQKGTIEGLFTLSGPTGNLFTRMPARSGQEGYTDTDWVSGKSPIPYGVHTLFLKLSNAGEFPSGGGLGEFYPIGQAQNSRLITGPTQQERWDIGLHPENAYPGSAGCIVLRWDTPALKIQVNRLFKFLGNLTKTQNAIRLEVL